MMARSVRWNFVHVIAADGDHRLTAASAGPRALARRRGRDPRADGREIELTGEGVDKPSRPSGRDSPVGWR